MSALPIEDMSRTYLEHSMVIHNFVIKIGNQIKESLCRENVVFLRLVAFYQA